MDRAVNINNGKKMLFIQEITETKQWEKIKKEWELLLIKGDGKTPFLTYEWLEAWWQYFGESQQLLILVCRNEEYIKAILPLMITKRSRRGITYRTLQFVGTGLSDNLGIIDDSEDETVYETFIQHLKKRMNTWDLIDLNDMSIDDHSTVKFIGKLKNINLKYIVKEEVQCPYIIINKRWEKFYKTKINKRTRSGNRTKFNRLKEMGIVKFRSVIDTAECQDAFEKIFKMKQRHISLFNKQNKRQFFRTTCKRFAEKGWLKLYLIEFDEQLISYLIFFCYENIFYEYFGGFNEAYSAYAPGRLLVNYAFEDIFESDAKEINLLRGGEQWKKNWSESFRWNVRIKIRSTKIHSRIASLIHEPRSALKKIFY